jgi:hypothetical protein
MRLMTFRAERLSLRDITPSNAPVRSVGELDEPRHDNFVDVVACFVCVENRDNDASISLAATHLRRIYVATTWGTALLLPFFHLSRRAISSDDPRRTHSAIERLTRKLRDIPVIRSSFGFHKEMISTGFALVDDRHALYGTSEHGRPVLELVMCRCSVTGDERFWVFAWASSELTPGIIRAATHDIRIHRNQFATPAERLVVSNAPFGLAPAGDLLAAKLGCDMDVTTSCGDGFPEWRVIGAPGSVVYRSY